MWAGQIRTGGAEHGNVGRRAESDVPAGTLTIARGAKLAAMANTWPPILEPLQAGHGRVLSVEDWLSLPEDEEGEFVAGRLVEERRRLATSGATASKKWRSTLNSA